jgi:hypothetical protein
MAAGTSPAIDVQPGDGYEVAFQANTGHLFVYDTSGNKVTDSGLGMAAGTSPSIVRLPGGGYQVAFQASTGHLFTYDPQNNTHTDSGLGMAAGTSPSVADGTEVAFQASTGHLYLYHPADNVSRDVGLGMAARTSPSLARSPAGGYDVAFQANTGHLFVYDTSGNKVTDSGLGMAAGTSPSVAASPTSGYEVAFQASTGHLFTYNPQNNTHTDAGLGMASKTSPATTAPLPEPSSNCAAANSCTPQTFADAILTYPGVNGVVTASNEYALETWGKAESGGAGCPGQPARTAPWAYSAGPAGNPINTTQPEPGSTDWNSVGVKIYADADGETCWHWGIKANGDTLLNGFYGNILSVLENPVSDDHAQCVSLAEAVGNSPWGTGNFSADC